MTTTNPTLEEWQAMLAAYKAAAAADMGRDDLASDDSPERARADAAYDALMAARPTSLVALAAQLRWIWHEAFEVGENEDDGLIVAHIAARLEAMAPRGRDLADVVAQARVLAGRLQDPSNRDLAAAIAERFETMAAPAPDVAEGELAELCRQIPADEDYYGLGDAAADALAGKAIALTKQITAAPITSFADALVKLSVARRWLEEYHGRNSGGYEGAVTQLVTDVHAWLAGSAA
jgi:hypothetical protein